MLTVGSVGGARLKEAECQGWAAVDLSAEAAPLYLDLTYDYDGGKIFGVPNPSRVMNPEYESWLILNSRPFREGFHLSFMEIGYPYDYQQCQLLTNEFASLCLPGGNRRSSPTFGVRQPDPSAGASGLAAHRGVIDCTLPGEACSAGAVPFSGTRVFRRYSFPIR